MQSAEQQIGPGSTGRVQTFFGVWLPFRVTEFIAGQHWGWEVDESHPDGSTAKPLTPSRP